MVVQAGLIQRIRHKTCNARTLERRLRQALRLGAVVALGLTAAEGSGSVAIAAQPETGQSDAVTVPSEVYPASTKAALDNREPQRLKRVYARDTIPNSVRLPPVTEPPPPSASDTRKGRLQVGFSRDIPSNAAASLKSAALIWDAVDGGSVTTVSVVSPGAVGVRLAVAFASLPKGTELRFFEPGGDSQVFGPVTTEQIHTLTVPGEAGEPGVYWSPVVPGDTAAMEIFVPAGLERELSFAIPRVSHHYRSAESADKAAGSCNIDVACSSPSWATTARATAKITFISGGSSYMCTGTLLNDTDTSTFIPYFMTAEHCVSTQSEASTINSYWNYQRTTCGGLLGSPTLLYNGAALLSHGTSSDHAFLRLYDPAPMSAVFSGWTSGTVSSGTPMVGIHHPAGDIKKISFGVVDGQSGYLGSVTGYGGFLRVHWSTGVTEGGSSGSGLITGSFPNDRFVGMLTGGYSSCSQPTAPDWYGRFDLVYPSISAYLSPVPPAPSVSTGVAGGIYTRGATLNGTANPNGVSTTAWFQYGPSASYGSTTPPVNLGAGITAVAIGQGPIAGLACNTVYHFRAVAMSAGGTTAGASGTFKTPRCTTANGDVDGDGRTDLGVYRPSTGTWHILPSGPNSTSFAQPWGVSTDSPQPGDYDGDGKMDLAVYRPSTGVWWVLQSSTNYTTYFAQPWGTSTDLPVRGDYDGDGRADLAVFRPSTGMWYALLSSTNYTSYLQQQWGASTDLPVPGDYDGDGRVDFAVYQPSTGMWYALLSSANYTSYLAQQWGAATDVPVPADYDGDGRIDLGLYRPSVGIWYVLLSSTNYAGYLQQQWGASTDVPLPADYDGDGRMDLGLYRPSTGMWYALLSSTNYKGYAEQHWGIIADIPVVKGP